MDAALQVVKALLGTLQEPPATPFSVLVVCSIAGIFFQIRDISRSRFSMQISKWFGGLGYMNILCFFTEYSLSFSLVSNTPV